MSVGGGGVETSSPFGSPSSAQARKRGTVYWGMVFQGWRSNAARRFELTPGYLVGDPAGVLVMGISRPRG